MTQSTSTERPDERVCVETADGWRTVDPSASTPGARWVIVGSLAELADAARRNHVGERAIALLEHKIPGRGPGDRMPRARFDRSPDGEVVLTTPTLSYVESTHDVHTGSLTVVVGKDVVLMTEQGDAHVLELSVDKLTGGYPVPDTGVQQVLAAVVLTLVAESGEVETGLGDAVASAERVVFSTGRHSDPLEQIYDLKREIAEARRALTPVTSILPELMADAEDAPGRRSQPWLRRAVNWVDRLDEHLDGYDHLLSDMLSVHLSQVSVRQNEDVRKISSWAAIAAAPTLVASIYGMNFQHMPELSWTFGYPLSIAVMAGVCVTLYRLFRRSGWL